MRVTECGSQHSLQQGCGESVENLRLMAAMDRLFTDDPTLGVLVMQDELAEIGMHYNIKRIRRLLRIMGVELIYSKRNLLRLDHGSCKVRTSLSSASFRDYKTQSGVGRRYHLHPDEAWVYVPVSNQ